MHYRKPQNKIFMIKALVQQVFTKNNKAILVGLIPFIDMLPKVRYSYRDEINDLSAPNLSRAYQRQIDPSRVSEIAKYIVNCIASNNKGSINAIFPNSIILAFGLEEESFNYKLGEVADISIPYGTMIVDGQHRLAGLEFLYRLANESSSVFGYSSTKIIEFLTDYKFNCTVLLNFDMWEQAQVFANINFNQKKVNKSLFYDIYGVSIPLDNNTIIPKQNEIYLAHELVVFLDTELFSVFRGFVKMLGKGAGYVSQSFLVEALMRHFRPRGIWADAVSMFKENDDRYRYIAYELTAYLAAIRSTFKDYWPDNTTDKPKSVLCKTSGVGAIILLLHNAHYKIADSTLKNIQTNTIDNIVYSELIKTFMEYLSPLAIYAEELFGLDSKYSRGAGAGMQKALYNRMLQILGEY